MHVKRDLADNFFEALLEKFFAYRADTAFACLALHQLLVKHFSQTGNIDPRGWLWASFLHPVFAYKTHHRKRHYSNARVLIQLNSVHRCSYLPPWIHSRGGMIALRISSFFTPGLFSIGGKAPALLDAIYNDHTQGADMGQSAFHRKNRHG